jgi:hypothetical protein
MTKEFIGMKKNMTRFGFLGLSAFLFCFCDVSAAVINAGTCSFADVSEAVSFSSEGDTILVPAGECAWSDQLVINKTIIMAGAGIDATIIKSNMTSNGPMIYMKSGAPRITGFKFDHTGTGYPISMYPGGDGWRIDHCLFTKTAGKGNGILVRGTQDDHPYGLIDNCNFFNSNVLIYGDAGADAYIQWTDDRNFGSDEFIFIENCDFEFTVWGNAVDGNCGNKTVVRFCTFINTYVEQHSVQGDVRGTKAFELYNNTLTAGKDVKIWSIWPRGGTGFIFNNRFPGFTQPLFLDNVRSAEVRGDYFLKCSGTSPVDGNENSTGWPCRDQIGRGKDIEAWPAAPHPKLSYPRQESMPAYFWGNGALVTVSERGGNSAHIKADRDFYEENSSFDGSSGVGSGLLSSRPSTCTPGVAFWATDRGTWNKTGSGGQGVLYKCVSENQWELYYTPYTYPHPLKAAGIVETTEPPTELEAIG